MNFYEAFQEAFEFLESDYNFKLCRNKIENWGFEILYTNKTTGVKITYEYRESCFFINLYRLIDEIFIDNPKNISHSNTLNGYSLGDIISIRNSKALIKPGYEYSDIHKYHDPNNGAFYYTADVAESLRKYADDVLQGNFEIFSQIDRIVKSRIDK